MVFRWTRSVTRALKGVGPGNRDFFGPWNGYERGECHGPRARRKDRQLLLVALGTASKTFGGEFGLGGGGGKLGRDGAQIGRGGGNWVVVVANLAVAAAKRAVAAANWAVAAAILAMAAAYWAVAAANWAAAALSSETPQLKVSCRRY